MSLIIYCILYITRSIYHPVRRRGGVVMVVMMVVMDRAGWMEYDIYIYIQVEMEIELDEWTLVLYLQGWPMG